MEAVLTHNPNRWTVVTFHHPIYSTAKWRDNEHIREAWRPFLWALAVLGLRNWLVPDPPTLAWLSKRANGAIALDEAELFGRPSTWRRRIGELALVTAGFTVLTIAMTWPQAIHMDMVPDVGDPLFSI